MRREPHVRFCERAAVKLRRATHLVMGFEKTDDARRMMVALTERLAKFGLAIHDEKTRADRVWPITGFGSATAWTAASRDLRVPRLHPLLRVDAGRPVHCEAQNAEQAPNAKAEGVAPGGVAADACAAGRAASLVHQRSARSLRLLWPTTKLPGAHRVPSGSAPHLADLPATAQSENAAHELADLCGSADKLPPSNTSDHSSLDGSCSMTQVILGKSRVREICMPGSVRAKAEWLSYSTITHQHGKRFSSCHDPSR